MALEQQERVTMGRVGRVYGIKGWLRLMSYTAPMENILGYRNLQACINGRWQAIEMDDAKVHGKGLVAHFVGYDDPDAAKLLTGVELAVLPQELPPLQAEDFYWHELVGMRVVTETGQFLGTVARMMETGANDVLVVQPAQGSMDTRERLIPYLPGRVVTQVSREQRSIQVDWEPDYLA